MELLLGDIMYEYLIRIHSTEAVGWNGIGSVIVSPCSVLGGLLTAS